MECKIPYLDENYQGNELEELRNKHISVVKKVIDSKLFRRINDKLYLSKDIAGKIRQRQNEFVESLKSEGLKINYTDEDDYLSLKVDVNGSDYFEFNLENLTDDEEEMKNKTEFSELLNDESSQLWFDGKIVEVKKVLQNYIDLLQDKAIDYPLNNFGLTLGELKSLRNILSNKDNVEIISGLNSYIEKAVQWADVLNDQLFGTETNSLLLTINNQETTKENYDIAVKELAQIANKSKHFLYLFDNLKDFRQDLIDNGFITDEKFTLRFYNQKDVFKDAFKKLNIPNVANLQDVNLDWLFQILSSSNVSIEDFKDEALKTFISLNESVDGEPFNDYNKIKEFEALLNLIIEKNTKLTFNAQMLKSLTKVENIKTKVKTLHYTTASKFLFPIYNEKQISAHGIGSDKLITEEQFKTLLSLADGDDNDFNSMIETIANTNDAITGSVYAKFIDLQADKQFINIQESGDIMQLHNKAIEGKTIEQQHEMFQQMQTYNSVLEEDNKGNYILAEIGDEFIEVQLLNETVKYKTKRVNSYHSNRQYSDGNYRNSKNKGYVYSKLNLLKNSLYEYVSQRNVDGSYVKDENGKQVYKSKGILNDIASKYDTFENMFNAIPDDFYYKKSIEEAFVDSKGLIYKYIDDALFGKNKDEQQEYIKGIIKKAIIGQFNQEHFQYLDETESAFIIKSNNLENNLTDEFISQYGTESNGTSKLTIKQNVLPENILGYKKNGNIYIFYKDIAGDIKFGKYDDVKRDVVKFFYKTVEFKEIKDKYNVGKYSGNESVYFDYIKKKYYEYNSKLPRDKRLKWGIVQQFGKTGIELAKVKEDAISMWKAILNWFGDAYKNFRNYWNDNEKEQTTENIVDYQQQYLNGLDVKQIKAKGTTIFDNQIDLNPMLNESMVSFIMAANQQEILKQVEPQFEIIKTITYGDVKLGIEQRMSKIKNFSGKYILNNAKGKSEDRYKKKIAKNLNSSLTEFIDQELYALDDIPFGNIGANKLEKVLTKGTGYMSLALNIGSMISNLFNGKISSYLESVQGTFFTQEDYWEAEKEYWKPENSAKYVSDYLETNINNKSFHSQLLIWTDGIQGEFIDSFDVSVKPKKWDDLAKTVITFTQNAPEHEIQTVNMIAMLKKDGLYDKYKANFEKNKGVLSFTKTELAELKTFQSKLHSVNRNLNGVYANIDKTRLQRRWFGRLVMMFRKHIFQFFKSRFGGERLDIGSGSVMRGYVRSYYAELINDILSEKPTSLKAIKLFKQWGMDSLRLGSRVIERATFGKLKLDTNLYKEFQNDQRKLQEAKRYIAEMSTYTMITLLAVFVKAVEDDDDEALQALELILRKESLDMGMFLPTMVANPITFTSAPYNTYDGLKKIVVSPITAMRTIDNTVSLLGQLTGVKYEDSSLDFAFNDVYEQSGSGYEKGDLKLNRKLQKTLLAPYWQVLKFLNPEDQLQYLNVINKNSK